METLRRSLLAMMLLVATLALASSTSAGAGNTQLVFGGSGGMFQQPVEQQSPNFFFNNCNGDPNQAVCDPSQWVYNPFAIRDPYAPDVQENTCIWDVDDAMARAGQGYIPAGTTTGSVCQVADGLYSYGHYNNPEAIVRAPNDSLTVTVTSDQGSSWTLSPVPDTRGTVTYKLCGVLDAVPGPYPTIPDSNGGYGIPVHYTLSITAPKKTSNVFAVVQVGGRFGGNFGIC